MMYANRVILHQDAQANLDAMRPDVERRARGLIVTLAAASAARRDGSIDFGMRTPDGLVLWAYQDDEFWLYYTEETDGSLAIIRIWER